MATKKVKIICFGCGEEFEKEERYVKVATKKGRNHFCSLSCQMSYKNRIDTRFSHLENLSNKHFKPLPEFRWYFQRTKSRNMCNLKIEDIRDQWLKQKGKCALTGLTIRLKYENPGHFEFASLDRIDSNKPYELGNIQFVVLPLNLAKQEQPQEEMINFLKTLQSSEL